MSEQILKNPAALEALKRHQLVSLSKRYGLKASGKNIEMIERLQGHAATLADGPDADFLSPLIHTDTGDSNAGTPARDPLQGIDASLSPPLPFDLAKHLAQPDNELHHKASVISAMSDSWEVLSESGASLISPSCQRTGTGQDRYGTTRSWKSAGNGESLTDFGAAPDDEPERKTRTSSGRSRGSMFARASSMTRSAFSRSDLALNVSAQTPASVRVRQTNYVHAQATLDPATSVPENTHPYAPVSATQPTETPPPSPASTVGVPKRYSRINLLERPSTLRLCSPTPGRASRPIAAEMEDDDLPFVGSAHKLRVTDRRSMAPLRSAAATLSRATPNGLMVGRKSMPAIPGALVSGTSASIYPPLPMFETSSNVPPAPPLPVTVTASPMPGSWLSSRSPPRSAAPFAFGTDSPGVSSAQFSDAAQAILQQMNAKLPEEARMGSEYLKGKAAMPRMESVESGLGGWGLGSVADKGKRDRYAEAHEREFAKMQSIGTMRAGAKGKTTAAVRLAPEPMTPGKKRKLSGGSAGEAVVDGLGADGGDHSQLPSAPNGAPLAKKKKLSPGPNYLGSLREAGRSVMTLLGEGEERRVTGRTPKKRGGLRTRLSLMSPFKRAAGAPMPRGDREEAGSSATSAGPASSSAAVNAPALPAGPRPQKTRMPSSSAQTMLSTSSKSTLPPRAPIPDFGLGQRTPSGSSTAPSTVMSMGAAGSRASGKKQSQADLIRQARPAPPPPSAYAASTGAGAGKTPGPSVSAVAAKRSSTLMQPTAASRARMQATVKPPASMIAQSGRPLPSAPALTVAPTTSPGTFAVPALPPTPSFNPRGIATSNPFGMGESREDLFMENFHRPPAMPVSPPLAARAGGVTGAKPLPAVSSSSGPSKGIAGPRPMPSTPGKGRKALAGGTPGRANTHAYGSMRGAGAGSGAGGGAGLKPASSAALRARQRSAGVLAVKSRGDLRGEMEVQRRRAEVRAKNERRAEERELREMLGE